MTEDPPPTYITKEEHHLLTEHSSTRLIWGEGNPKAPIFVVLDNPGARENKAGVPFLCGTRQTLQTGARDAGIDLQDLYVSFLLKARPVGKYDKEKARKIAKGFLLDQIKHHQPKIVFCLGTVVVQSYFADPEISVRELRGRRFELHKIKTYVSYHPLAVRRRPVLYKYFVNDFALVAGELQNIRATKLKV